MPQFVNTNIASLNAQRNLNSSQSALQTSLQRLSSGLRINSARDDAAGMAIADRMTSQIRGANQAVRNANDGISMAQTAEGSMIQISDNLQRIRELAVQASNASNSASDRAALNAEASQLISEIDRVATNTSFNGVKLLDGTFTSQNFQVGADAGSSNQISITSIASARTASLGVGSGSSYSATAAGATTASATSSLAAGDITINGYQVGATTSDGVSNTGGTASGIAKAAAINAVSGQTNVTATVSATGVVATGAVLLTSNIVAGDVLINGVDIGAVATGAGDTATTFGSRVAAAINKVSAQTGVTATSAAGVLTLAAADGRNITTLGTANGELLVAIADQTKTAAVTLSSSSSSGIVLSANAAGITAGFTPGSATITTTAGAGVSSLDLTTASGATAALTTIDAALSSVNSSRASLGAYQNRLGSAVSSLQTTAENLTNSRSRISDADFAAETASLTRAQILQQAGTAMLAQANQTPNTVLTLLR